ncbi:hypothetical protein AQUCO_02200152v1 [Aquilegia coerulea]|uniref:F-box domain-containing protein n=1 Tax=Aquilegia coerulea TaxID=218851 RepID=A0A2G5DDD8_AQUCA|nr:hypothetical protein AQUCO_02200152v1 [Aquilegia coerulea]
MDGLPQEIRSHIVSFLPTKEAIRTSILSKKWKTVCSSLSNFNFEQSYSKEGKQLSLQQFIEIIYQTLGQHDESDINIFQLNLNDFLQNPDEFVPHIYKWISFATSHNVHQLHLFGSAEGLKMLPFCLVSCNSLTVLSLTCINLILSSTNIIRLPNLKTLDLCSVTFSDVGVTNQLFSSCPALESLTISYCFWTNSFNVLTISSPNLKDFTLGYFECFQEIDLSTKNLQKLFYQGLSPNLKTEIISTRGPL